MLLESHEPAAARCFLRQRMEPDPASEYAGQSAALADGNALQLGTQRRHDAIISGSREAKRSSLFGGLRGGGRYSRATRISTVVTRYRINRSAGSCHLCLSKERAVGIDCALA